VVLHPYFGYWVSASLEFRRRAIDASYEETKKMLAVPATLAKLST
jgi:hypothetical protein